MQVVPLGKVVVATAGTPVPITAAMISAAGGSLPPNNCAHKIEVWPDPAMSGAQSYVKFNGVIVAPLVKPGTGVAEKFCAATPAGGNTMQVTNFSIDVATNGDGAYVTVFLD